MKKKIFSILLSLCMVLTMIPVAAGVAWAEGTSVTNSVTIGGKTLNAENHYYHNGENGVAGEVNETETDANATFDSDNGTLTLNGLNLTSGNISATGNGNLTILLTGENRLGSETYSSNVIYVNNGNLAIVGPGALTAENASGASTTIYVNGDITINGGANVTAIHAGGEAQAIHASGVNGKIIISGAGTEVTATHNGSDSNTGNDYVALKAGTQEAGTIQISDGAKLTAKGAAKAVYGTLCVDTLANYKIYAGDSQDSAAEQQNPAEDLTALSAYKYLKFEPQIAAPTALEDVKFEYAYDVQRSPDYPDAVGAKITTSIFKKPLIYDSNSSIRAESNKGSWKLTRVGTYSYVKNQTLNNSDQKRLGDIVNAVSQAYGNLNKEAIVIHELKNGNDHIAYGVVIAYDAEKGKAVFIGDTWQGGGCYLLSTSKISESETSFDIIAGKIATGFVQDISISLDIDTTKTLVFQPATVGYGEQTPKTVTVINTGNAETGDLTVALSNYSGFILSLENQTISSITEGEAATFSIKPQTGLLPGEYNATVTVSGRNIVAQSFGVSFTVNANAPSGSIKLSEEGTYTFQPLTVGYTTHAAKEVTITNTGNVATGNLTVALSGGEESNFTVGPKTINSIAAKDTENNQDGTATFNVAPKNGLSVGEYTEAVTVSGDNIDSLSFNVSVTVNAAVTKTLTSIAVTTAPTKTNYTVGESFDPAGMVVTATYSDDSTKVITGYTFTSNAALTTDDTSITISYTEGEVTKTATQAITVNALEYNITVTDGKATQGEGTEISKASVGTTVTLTANATSSGKVFDKWVVESGEITLADVNSATTTFTMPAREVKVKATYKDVPHTGGGSHSSSIQKPTIIAGEGAETSLSLLGTNLTIKMTEGYELTDVILNGVSKGKVTELTGLRTGDKVEVKTEKKQEKPTKEEIIAALDNSKLVARSKLITLENGKKAVRVTWYDQNGNEIDFDGIEVYRSVKRYKGYGLKPFYTTKGNKSEGYYVNTKDLKEGTTYYYKVRGYVTIDGQKYYTDYSLKAIRTIR